MIDILNTSHFSSSGPRPNQEDYIKLPEASNQRIFVLCDGMGGHGHGEVASKVVAEAVFNFLYELNPETYTEEDLQSALDFAIEELAKADVFSDEKPMGTTIVVIAINKMNIIVGHVGDSRCYLFSSDGERKFRTKDHSKVQEAVDAEILTEDEAWSSPKKNILTRCIQSKSKHVKIEVDCLTIENGDTILLCSDGVTDALQDRQLQSFVIGRDAEDFASCIKIECELSSRDNFSAIILKFSQDEHNPSSTINNECSVTENIIDENVCFCQSCGSKVNRSSSFCPSCGKDVNNASFISQNHATHSGSKLWDSISRSVNDRPMPFIIGALLTGVAVGGFVGYSMAPNSKPTNHTHINDDKIMLNQVTGFINEICYSDTLNPQDSIILKTDVLSQYQKFLNSLKK